MPPFPPPLPFPPKGDGPHRLNLRLSSHFNSTNFSTTLLRLLWHTLCKSILRTSFLSFRMIYRILMTNFFSAWVTVA